MPIYAQVQNGRIIAITDGPSQMIPLETYDSRLLNTFYTGPQDTYAGESDFSGFKSVITADKNEIAADGVDSVTIQITIKDWKDTDATNYNGVIRIYINGARKDLTVTDGMATYAYKTATSGSKAIMTQDADGYIYISHGSVTVQAYGDLEEL